MAFATFLSTEIIENIIEMVSLKKECQIEIFFKIPGLFLFIFVFSNKHDNFYNK